ncbi:MAG: hypothetical protein A3B68_02935 [Candidatus Melainabacteria bacterium RIFCSPHIGHO2_02_FULL_34_12]|nr:MAG: hypothetical protein A3B68_02935 [Candidatus Melainabacteria bacterium RIFCSPHIGHO2_02_FULL_34_12]
MSRREKILIVQLFLFFTFIGLYLRLAGVGHSASYSINPAEASYVLKIISPFRSLFQFHSFHSSPLFLFINSLIVFISSFSFDLNTLLNKLDVDPAVIYLPLRYLSAFFSAGSVVIIYFIGSLFTATCGVLASGFLAVSLLHVKFSGLIHPFSGVIFFLLLSLYFTLKFNYKLSFLFALLSSLMHYSGLISILPLLFVLALKKEYVELKSVLGRFVFLSVILNLFVVIDFVFLFPKILNSYFIGYNNYHLSSFLLYLFKYLWHGVGPVVWLSAVFSLLYLKNYDNLKIKVLFLIPIAYLAFIGLFHFTELGYAVLLVPFFCLASALFFSSFYREDNERKFIFILLVLFALWIPFKYSVKYNKLMSLPDTRTIASDWVKENVSDRMKIAWDKNSLQLNWQNAYDKKELKGLTGEAVLLLNRRNFPIEYDLLKKKDWFKFLRKKADYVVINSYDYELTLKQSGQIPKKKYYLKMLKQKPYMVFDPYLKDYDKKTKHSLPEELYSPFLSLWQRERSGPVIKVYKI